MNPAARLTAVAALLLVTAAGLASLLFVPVGGSVEKGFEPGEPATLALSGEPTVVWASTRTAVRCEIADPGTDAGWSQMSLKEENVWIRKKRSTWYGAVTLAAWPAGDYQVTCDGGADLAVGKPPLVDDARTGSLLILGSFFAAVAGLGLFMVARVRRPQRAT